jgi:hypothetical protein
MVLAKAGGLGGISYQAMPAFANTIPLAANAMKFRLFLISFFICQVVCGPSHKDTTISKRTLDSLKSELWQKSETINRIGWAYRLKVDSHKVDTVFLRPDSLVVTYWTKEKKHLYQESINLRKGSFKKDFCKGLIVKRFFNRQGQGVYIERWDGLCYDETDKEKDEIYFDSRLRQIERVIYNNAGQIIRRMSHEYQSYRSEMTLQFVYLYDNGIERQTVQRVDKNSFWN